jgi:hypothetical protein
MRNLCFKIIRLPCVIVGKYLISFFKEDKNLSDKLGESGLVCKTILMLLSNVIRVPYEGQSKVAFLNVCL